MKKVLPVILSTLSRAERILFITGAGISQESGIPTYRGYGGMYEEQLEQEMKIEELLTPEMMRFHPEIVWSYIYRMEQRCRHARPNKAHLVIAEMEAYFPFVLTVTQNVDGLHGKAGSNNVIQLHGYIYELLCMECGNKIEVNDFTEIEIPPHCSRCGGILRPDVVLFGEALPQEKYEIFLQELKKGFDILFSIGTTALFPYITFPVYEVKKRGGLTVEINPDVTSLSSIFDIRIPEKAGCALTFIWQKFKDRI